VAAVGADEQTLRVARKPDISGTAVDYLAFLSLARQTASLGHAIGFPRVC
jgi:hypothetical protein